MSETEKKSLHELISQRAYALWEAAGWPHDRSEEFWHQASKEIGSERAEEEAPLKTPEVDEREPR